MKNKKKLIKVILGDIAYPKSQALIIPGCITGLMTEKIPKRILKDGWKGILNEAKEKVNKNNLDLTDFFTTEPGRLKRRGVKKIYHTIIKRVPSDFTSITIINKALTKVLTQIVKDRMISVTISGLGVDRNSISKSSIARVIVDTAKKFLWKLEICIIDDDVEFIEEINYFVEKGIKNERSAKQTSTGPKQGLDRNKDSHSKNGN